MVITSIFYKILYLTIVGSIAGLIVCLIRNIFDKKLSGKWRCIMWFIVLATLLIPIRYEIKTTRNVPNNIINNIEDIKTIAERPVVYHELSENESKFEYEDNEANSNLENMQDNNIEYMQEKTAEEVKSDIVISNKDKQTSNNHLPINYIITNMIIPSIWLIGTLIFAGLLISGVFQIRNKSKKGKLRDERISLILENCKEQLNINKKIKIVLQENCKTSIFGIFKPVILVSKNILNESDETIKYIFLHELSHYKRKDPIFNYILLFTLSIHWFNPIVWFIFMKVREDIELGADELAIEKLNKQEKKEYGLVLIKLLQSVSRTNYTANMLCISDTEKNMERRILMIKGKNKSKILSAIIVIAIIAIVAGIVFIKTEKVDLDVNAGLASNLNEENYSKVWIEPQKFESYQEYMDYSENLYKEKYPDTDRELTNEEKSKLISEEVAREKIESILSNIGQTEKISSLELHKRYIDTATYNYEVNLGKSIILDIDAENGEFLNYHDESMITKQLKEDTLNFEEAKKKAIELYENMDFLKEKYKIYSIVEGEHYWGAGTLDKSGIQYSNKIWESTFYATKESGVLNKYQQLLIHFFVSDGKIYITAIREIDKKKMDITIEKSDMQDNPVVIKEEKAVEIAKQMDKKISGKEVETTRTTLVNNEVNEYAWIQEKSDGEDTGLVTEKVVNEHDENETIGDSKLITTAQTYIYNQYYYPKKIIRNTYEVKIDYSGDIIIEYQDKIAGQNRDNGNIGRIYYVDCTTGEIIGGRNYGGDDTTMDSEYMEKGDARMATKDIYFDITTGEKVAERNYNYSQELIDSFMNNN